MSEIGIHEAAEYLKIDPEEMTTGDKAELDSMVKAAKKYVCEYEGISPEECDRHEELSIAVLLLCQDMYDNRTRYVASSQGLPSKTLETLLSLHDHNLI